MATPNLPEGAPQGPESYDPATDPNIPHFEYTPEQVAQMDEAAAAARQAKVTGSDVTGYSKTGEYPAGRSRNGQPQFTRAEDFYRYAEARDKPLQDHIAGRTAEMNGEAPSPDAVQEVAEKAKHKGWLTRFLRRS